MIMKSVFWVCMGMYSNVIESVTLCSELIQSSVNNHIGLIGIIGEGVG